MQLCGTNRARLHRCTTRSLARPRAARRSGLEDNPRAGGPEAPAGCGSGSCAAGPQPPAHSAARRARRAESPRTRLEAAESSLTAAGPYRRREPRCLSGPQPGRGLGGPDPLLLVATLAGGAVCPAAAHPAWLQNSSRSRGERWNIRWNVFDFHRECVPDHVRFSVFCPARMPAAKSRQDADNQAHIPVASIPARIFGIRSQHPSLESLQRVWLKETPGLRFQKKTVCRYK